MKNLFATLLIMVLISCGSSLEPALESPKSNTDYKNIIGKPIKIGNIEVAQYDFPDQMNWNDAEKACETFGDGWRLPTKDELNFLYLNKDKIGSFTDFFYWSSTELIVQHVYNAWGQDFEFGGQDYDVKTKDYYVRAIRTF